MTQVNMQNVKELRDRTQAGLNDCRSALIEAEGNMDKAVEIILKKGLAKSAKRAGAIAAEGLVAVRVGSNAKSGVIVEVNIQTDFAARNAEFVAFVDNVVAVAEKAADGADLGKEPYPDGSGSVEERRQALVGKLGENIQVRRFQRVRVPEAGLVQSYVHMGGKIGVLLAIGVGKPDATGAESFTKFADDTAMQIAAMAPLYLDRSAVPEADKKTQADIFNAQLTEEGKPEAARPKIIEGKLAKWYKEVCLAEQPSVLETEKSIDQLRAGLAKELGTDVRLLAFVRFQCGEGVDKPTGDDFATEVMKMSS